MALVPATLSGEDARRSKLALSLAFGLAFAIFGLGALVRANSDPLLVVSIILVLTGLATVNAYWNDGLLVSWLLVFAPFAGWTWQALGPVFGGAPHDTPMDVLEIALYPATLAFGTAGYIAGRVIRILRDAEATGEFTDDGVLLFGRDPALVARHVKAAGGLFIVGASVIAAAQHVDSTASELAVSLFYVILLVSDGSLLAVPVVLVWVGIAAWSTYRTGGVLSGWALLFGATFGAYLVAFVTDSNPARVAVSDAFLALVTALGFATVFGAIGFICGKASRRVR